MVAWLAALLLLAIAIGWFLAQDAWRIPILVFAVSAGVAALSPVAALCLLILTFPTEIMGVGSGGTYARLTGLGVGTVLLPQVVAHWLQRNRGCPRISIQAAFLWGFLVFSLLSGIFAQDAPAWLKGIWMLVSRAGLFAVVYHHTSRPRQTRILLGAVAVSVLIAAALGMGEWLWGYRVAEARTFRAEATINAVRASGVFESPISLSFALVAGIGSASLFLVTGRRLLQFGSAVAIAIMMVALALTMTRSAALGLAVFVGILLILPGVLPRWSRVALVLLIVVIAGSAPTSVKRRFTSMQFLSSESSIHNRPLMLLAGARMAAANPLGVGLRNFELHYNDFKAVQDVESNRAGHNMFVELAGMVGIPGALCFIGWAATTGLSLHRSGRRALESGDRHASIAPAVLFATICAMLIQGLFHTNPYQDKFFWLFMALGAATGSQVLVSSSTPAEPKTPAPVSVQQ